MNRRSFLTGATTLLAAPAIVRVASIMPVKAVAPDLFWQDRLVFWGGTGMRSWIETPSNLIYFDNESIRMLAEFQTGLYPVETGG